MDEFRYANTRQMIPANIDTMDAASYDAFLHERRKMMAALIERYYKGL